MAATTLESFLNPPNPLTKRDRRCCCCCSSSLSSASNFSVRFKPVLIPITTPHSTTTRRTWTNISPIVARNTIINVSPPKLESRLLGTCFLSLDPIHRSRTFNSRLVVAVPAFASSAAKQDDDSSDEHSEIADDDVENDHHQKSTTEIAANDVENEVLLINAAEEEEEEEEEESQEEEDQEAAAATAAAANWNWNWNWRQIITSRLMLQVDSFKEYLIISADDNKSPVEVIKDIIVAYYSSSSSSSSTPDHHLIKDASNKLEDFHLGIPYGALLSLGGFLSFMITGSISGIRFGVILGGTLLALSISSLRYSYATAPQQQQQQQQQQAIMKLGQAAIAGIIFLRHLGLLFQSPSFPNSFTALISGGMLVFYLYTIIVRWWSHSEKQKVQASLKHTP